MAMFVDGLDVYHVLMTMLGMGDNLVNAYSGEKIILYKYRCLQEDMFRVLNIPVLFY